MKDGYDIEADVDLAELKLKHADDSDCKCDGKHHTLSLSLDLENHELHADYECRGPKLNAEAVQRLHEQAHPEGTLFAEYCPEASCADAIASFS